MTSFKQTLCALVLTMIGGVAIAQNNTNSPYTRYGFGELSDPYFGNSKAMGGVAFGLRDGMQINPLNPASYTAIDSLTFLFEGGVSLQNMNISTGDVKRNAKNSSFDYLAMQFRLRPWIAMSIGLLPYSNVGYCVTENQTANGVYFNRSYAGSGGLHQLYAGLGVKVLKNLSLGANVSYFWGDISRSRMISYPNTVSSYSYLQLIETSISDYKIDLGAQYTHDFGKKHSFTLGAVFSPKRKLNNKMQAATQVSGTTITNMDATLELPNTFGVGLTYNLEKRLTVGIDYSLQQWADTKFGVNTTDAALREEFSETYTLANRSKISVGAEFIPNKLGRSYLAHVKYRLGAFYSTPYYKIGGKKACDEIGVTGGFGLPIPRSRSILSLSGQFVRIKGLETGMVNENIFRVSIGLTFNENWFFKQRVE